MTDTLSPQRSKIADDDGNAHFVYDDGCRAAAGFKGKTGDCVCRPIAIATGRLYQEVYDALNALGSRDRVDRRKRSKSSARTGIYKDTKRRYLGRRAISRGFAPGARVMTIDARVRRPRRPGDSCIATRAKAMPEVALQYIGHR